jgi:Protein of unknown function (DUF433)
VVGSRVPVRRLWAFYRNGATIERILKRYPQLGPAKVFDALAFAFDNEEVVSADMAREDDFLARAGQKPARKSLSAQQIELPFSVSSSTPERPAARGPTAKR